MASIHTTFTFTGERQEERTDITEYQYVKFTFEDKTGELPIKTLLINKSKSGFCLLYIGKHVFYKEQILKHNNGKTYEVAWVEQGRGYAQFIGLQQKNERVSVRAKAKFTLIDEIDKSVMNEVSDTVSKFKSKSNQSVSISIFYVDQNISKLADYEFSGPTIILFYGKMSDVLSSIDHTTRKFAALSLDLANWRDKFIQILKFFFNIKSHTINNLKKIRESDKRSDLIDNILDQQDSLDRQQKNRIATIYDEMAMNGFYDAPTDQRGMHIYANQDRKKKVILPKDKPLELRYDKTQEEFWLQVVDKFGSMDDASLLKYIKHGIDGGDDMVNQGPGGAGLGLYMIYQYSQSLFVKINPKQETLFLSSVSLDRKSGRKEQNACFVQCYSK